jgi:hypothetical protein
MLTVRSEIAPVALNATLGPYCVNCVGGIFFYKVIVTNGMSEGGDSGSILLSDAGGAVGLLFVRLANPGLDGKNGSGGKLLRTDRPGVDASRRQAEIVQQKRQCGC